MEERSTSRVCSRESEEDVPTAVAMEKSNSKGLTGPVSGTVTAAAHWHSCSEETACFQHIFEGEKSNLIDNLWFFCYWAQFCL